LLILPIQPVENMKKAILIFICLCFNFILQAQVSLHLWSAGKAPVVDGYIDDVDDPWRAFIDMNVRNRGGTTNDMTAKFQILDGYDAFYVAIVVEDATPGNDATAIPNSYERDCSEIFFSMDTVTGANGAYKKGCWQIRTQRAGEILNDGNSGANTWSIATLTNDPNFKVASKTSATEYVQELILPIDVLTEGMDPVWEGPFFRFDISVSDNTTGTAGGRTGQRFWWGHNGLGDDHEWDNTRSLGIAMLAWSCCGVDPVWEVSPSMISITASEGSNSTVTLKSSVAWTATSDQTWLMVNPATGNSNATLTLTAGVNTTKEIRMANVTITASGNPSKTITVTQEAGTGTGLATISSEKINLYPNPVTDGFRVSGLRDKATICLTDLNGRLMFLKEVKGNETIPVNSLSQGIYIVWIINDTGSIKKKLVKE
jgi:hypothetical protein